MELSAAQYELVYAGFSLCIASMAAAFVFFMGARSQVGEKYRPALLVSALVVGIACYHYFRIFNSWEAAFELTAAGTYAKTAVPFNDAYRYADWLLTVPLLLVEVVAVLALTRGKAGPMLAKLSIAAVLMIATGYPGEIAAAGDNSTRLIWGTISTIPFLYILYVLWVELSKSLDRQPDEVKVLVRNLRLLILGSWGVYPIAYLFPAFGIDGAGAMVGLQVGYTLADLIAKPGMGLMIYAIARIKTRADQEAGAPAAGNLAAASA